MKITRKLFTKLRLVLYDHVFKNVVFGYNKRTKHSLDEDFRSGKWSFLESSAEKTRYDHIIKLYKTLKHGGSILDIGCGQGVLYKYLTNALPEAQKLFTGIDISSHAIEIAKKSFSEGNFTAIDYESEKFAGKFDVIIFNETLYYFGWPMKVLNKCIKENLMPDGIIIVSMHEYHGRNKRILEQIDKKYVHLWKRTITNKLCQSWDIIAFKPV